MSKRQSFILQRVVTDQLAQTVSYDTAPEQSGAKQQERSTEQGVAARQNSESVRGEVMLVEDNPLQRRLLTMQLSQMAFAVRAVSSAAEAINLLEDDANRFDLIVTDLLLKGAKTGTDVIREARQRNPAQPLLLITGADPTRMKADHARAVPVLLKPFEREQLFCAVTQAIDADPTCTPAIETKRAALGRMS